MCTVDLIYTEADGEAAARLRDLLATLGYAVNTGAAPAQAAAESSAALALLSPSALADVSVVGRLQRQPAPLPLPIANPAVFPSAEDLAQVVRQLSAGAAGSSTKYTVGANTGGAVGDNAVVVNTFGPGGMATEEVAALVSALRRRDDGATLTVQELRATLAALMAEVRQVGDRVAAVDVAVHQSRVDVLARFDLQEQRILHTLLARLDEQQLALTEAIVEVLETHAVAADELDLHLEVIEDALREVNQQAAQIQDRQLVASAGQVAEMFGAPGLDLQHKLKLTIPIIPLLLDYEGEVALNSRIDLEKTWQALRRWIGGSVG